VFAGKGGEALRRIKSKAIGRSANGFDDSICAPRHARMQRHALIVLLLAGTAVTCQAADDTRTTDMLKEFRVVLPKEKREFPEPLAGGQQPGFAWRGTKGWLWKPEQYLAEIPYIAQCRMNFLMNCYGSMCDIEHHKWGDPKCNRWYEPLPPEKKAAYEKVVREARQHGLTFCFSMNPNLSSDRFVNTGKAEDVDALWQHYAWMQGLGVQWFNVSLDDITTGVDAAGQSHVVNEILQRLRAKDPKAQMIFCPTYYWGDGTGEAAQQYLEEIARRLDKDVYLFWTGGHVVGPVTRKDAESYRKICGHRLFLWDNYPVNDAKPTMHLGPVVERDATLNQVVDGYMCNPLYTQNEINRIPMFTCADYAWNPGAYEPQRSIGQAILHLADKPEDQQLLADLVEEYAGMLVWKTGDTGFNAVRERWKQLGRLKQNAVVREAYREHLEKLAGRLDAVFPQRYSAEKRTLAQDVEWVRAH
jgi:hypothetical protein